MLQIGCHLSTAKGYLAMGKEALAIGANTFQFFSRNPRGSKAKEMDAYDANALMSFLREKTFAPIVAHAPYTLNPCSAEAKTREFAHMVMSDDLRRMEFLPHQYYNFHPGSHGGQGIDRGIELIITLLNDILQPQFTTTVLLETMAQKGSEVGGTFQEIRHILDGVDLKEKLGVCLDTCHVYDAGYDIAGHLDDVLEEFDAVIGLNKLKSIHLNDSMNAHASHKDRHAKIGEGSLGIEAIGRVINHPKLKHLPFILETPNDLPGYEKEILLLKEIYQNG